MKIIIRILSAPRMNTALWYIFFSSSDVWVIEMFDTCVRKYVYTYLYCFYFVYHSSDVGYASYIVRQRCEVSARFDFRYTNKAFSRKWFDAIILHQAFAMMPFKIIDILIRLYIIIFIFEVTSKAQFMWCNLWCWTKHGIQKSIKYI